jgi:hypothetical protein
MGGSGGCGQAGVSGSTAAGCGVCSGRRPIGSLAYGFGFQQQPAASVSAINAIQRISGRILAEQFTSIHRHAHTAHFIFSANTA